MKKKLTLQLRTMDHSARRSMKNAANCAKYGELQGSRNRNVSNAHCAFNILMLEARLSEGLLVYMTTILCVLLSTYMKIGVHRLGVFLES